MGIKKKNFDDWCESAKLILEEKHLTDHGLKKILELKQNMNYSRKKVEDENE